MYKPGQLVVIRRKIVDVSVHPFKFIRKPTLCRIAELPDGNFINSPCDFCDAMYCHCGYECKLEGTSLYYKVYSKSSLKTGQK